MGPVRIERSTGAPRTTHLAFAVPSDGSYCLVVNNADEESRRVTAGWIDLDGVGVMGPNSFLRHARTTSTHGTIAAGSHTLDVRAASGPRRYFDVELRFAPALSDATVARAESLALLEYAACRETVARLRFLSREAAASLIEDSVAMGLAPGQLRVRFNAYGVPSHLSPLPAEEDGPGSGADPRVIAQWWIEKYRHLFRWEDPRISLKAFQVKENGPAGSAVRFDEHVSDLRVDGARLEVQVDAGGDVRLVAGNFVPSVPASLTPRIAAPDATAAAQNAVGCPACTVLDPATLVVADLSIVTGEARSVLAWRVLIESESEPQPAWMWVDAETGDIIRREQDGFAAPDMRAVVVYSNEPDAPPPTPDAPRAAQVVFDNLPADPAQHVGFPCELTHRSWCPDLLLWVEALDLEWRTRFGRAGWSGSGAPATEHAPAIPADDAYRVLFEGAGIPGFSPVWFPGNFPSRSYRVDGPVSGAGGAFIYINQPNHLTVDTVAHEFGHGFWAVESAQRSPVEESSYHGLVFHEHVAEYTMLGRIAGECESCADPLRAEECAACREHLRFSHETADGQIGYEYDGIGCSGPAWVGCPRGCQEYTHLSYFDEEWFRAIRIDPETGRPVIDPETGEAVPDKWSYWNQCIFTKLGYILRRESAGHLPYHGVVTRPLVGSLAKWLFYRHFTSDAGVLLTPDDYGYFFRLALEALRDKCAPLSLPGAPPREPAPDCSPTEDEWAIGAAALDSLGFWSEVQDLSSRRDTIRPRTPPAAAVGGGFIWVASTVARDPDNPFSPHDLLVVRTDETTPGMVPAAFDLTLAHPEWTPRDRAVSVAFHEGAVRIAYMGAADGSIRFLHFRGGADDPVPVEGSPFVAPLGLPSDPPVIASCGGRLYLAYTDADAGAIMWASEEAVAPLPVDLAGTGTAYFPTLSCVHPDEGGDLLILAYVSGIRWVGPEQLTNLVALRRLRPGETAWSEEQLPEAMTSRRGGHARRSWAAVRTYLRPDAYWWMEPGIAVALHHRRLQFVFPAAESEMAGDHLRVFSAALAPHDSINVVEPMTGSRVAWLPGLTHERAAAVTAVDRDGASRLHVFWMRRAEEAVLQPYRLQSISKRSD